MDEQIKYGIGIKQNIIQPQKEGSPAICDNLDDFRALQYVKWIRERKTNTIPSHLCVESKKDEFIETEWNGGGQGLGLERNEVLVKRVQTSGYKTNTFWGSDV